jgi:DNA polymerase III delta prime subunit
MSLNTNNSMSLNTNNSIYHDIHSNLKIKLDKLVKINNIPHIIFHGPPGSGKRYLLKYLLDKIYVDINSEEKNKFIMYINCAHGKGIKFIRDEVIFFAKTNTINNSFKFKSIILFNSDKLTIDAQSALRRCIEKFSHTTRFFIVMEDLNRLLKPILSRFCNIYVPFPIIHNGSQSLYKKNTEKLYNIYNKYDKKRYRWLTKELNNDINFNSMTTLIKFVNILYNKAYSANNIMDNINARKGISDIKKYKCLVHFDNIKNEFRSEKLLILNLLVAIHLRIK